jgi:tRNA threonylcarbamoyladenosine biosynthesis protein TsaB
MLILTIRTDKPEAEIGLYKDTKKLDYETWQAHRELAETLHTKIHELLKTNNKDWADIQAIACFEGPGSFTGLRIGLSVANALAYSLDVPIKAGGGEAWINDATTALINGQHDPVALPEYGAPVHITTQKK